MSVVTTIINNNKSKLLAFSNVLILNKIINGTVININPHVNHDKLLKFNFLKKILDKNKKEIIKVKIMLKKKLVFKEKTKFKKIKKKNKKK